MGFLDVDQIIDKKEESGASVGLEPTTYRL